MSSIRRCASRTVLEGRQSNSLGHTRSRVPVKRIAALRTSGQAELLASKNPLRTSGDADRHSVDPLSCSSHASCERNLARQGSFNPAPRAIFLDEYQLPIQLALDPRLSRGHMEPLPCRQVAADVSTS
jgi:hypothetical protein